jgi:Putative zinc-finger
MRCLRIDLHRQMSRYIGGELSRLKVAQVEGHLLDCGECRSRVARLRSGHQLFSQIPRVTTGRDLWPEIEKAIEAERRQPAGFDKHVATAPRRLTARAALAITSVALGLSLAALLILAPRDSSRQAENVRSLLGTIDLSEFHPVRISEMEQTSQPHVMAEGYVSELRVNDEDGDLSFKLVDDLRQAEPFVVCEILDSIKVDPPPVGSRVRVYGVSRYDNKAHHQWYEVHPVLGIEVVRD